MKTILIDDEPLSLHYLESLCCQIPLLDIVATFDNSLSALAYLSSNVVELVITDIEMPGLSGIDSVQQFRASHPNIGVIFVTGYEDYAFSAFELDAVAYILKPCRAETLLNAVKRAQRLLEPAKSVEIRTFGYFTVLIHGNPVRFANSKAKELVALLVDRNGAVVTIEQATDVLWEHRTYDDMVKRLYRKAISYLHQVFLGTDFFVSERGTCHIVPHKADCDYFNFLQHPAANAKEYHGEYMSDYSWAESTNGKLMRLCGSEIF